MTEKDPTPPAEGENIGNLTRIARIGGHLAVSETGNETRKETATEEYLRTIGFMNYRGFLAREEQARRDGGPTEIFDLSLDELSEKRGPRFTHAAVVHFAVSDDVEIHPSVLEQAYERLRGRNPFIDLTETGVIVKFHFDRKILSDADLNAFIFSMDHLLRARHYLETSRLPHSSAS